MTELTREANQQNHRVRALLGDPDKGDVMSVMYLSLGEAVRKQDKYLHTALWGLKIPELRTLCEDCFRKKRNRTTLLSFFFQDLNIRVKAYRNSGMLCLDLQQIAILGTDNNPSAWYVYPPHD